jgi:hypothetical protein
MKFDSKNQTMTPDNLVQINGLLAGLKTNFPLAPLLLLMAEVCDRAINGTDTYVILGLTKDRSALLFTIREGANVARAAGPDLLGVAADAERLL